MEKKIYLVGFMGSGKSYMGKALAQSLDWEFLDMDDFLEANEGMTISQIFAEGGESLFRQLEKNYLRATFDFQNTVIATGGGAPCFHNNMDWMNTHGTTIYLDTPVSVLAKRLKKETAHRPLLANKSVTDLSNFIKKKLIERTPYYKKSNTIFTYQTGHETPADLLAHIV